MHASYPSNCIELLRRVYIIFVLLLYASAALASATDEYNDGTRLFEEGAYESAIGKFESAINKGMSTPAVFYNLGSAYFKIGSYSTAKVYFSRVAKYPDKRALAEYNLGLIAIKQNDAHAALQHFEYAKQNSKDEKIVAASEQKITNLQTITKPWKVLLVANVGYDDNISVTPDNLAVGVDDSFYNVLAKGDVVVHGKRLRGWLVDANYFRIDYTDSGDFNQDYYSFGLRNEHRVRDWNTIAHLSTGRNTFGDEDLQSFYRLNFLGDRTLSGNQKIVLQYRYDDFSSKNSTFDYLEGWRQRAQVRYAKNTVQYNLQLYYELELNERGQLVTPALSYEFSPTRHTLGSKYIHKFSSRWYLTGDVSYRDSDFPASATVDRNDDRWLINALLDYRIDSTLLVKANVKYIDNESTFDLYTYDRTVMSLGVSKQF